VSQPANPPLRTRILLPTYDEVENLRPMVEALRAAAPRASILVLDDNSPDGTGRLADQLAKEHPEFVTVAHRPGKGGLGKALRDGFARAIADGFDVALTMDVDFSHDPADVPRLIAAVEAGADIAIGSRYVKGGSTPDWSLSRRLISRGGNFYARTLLRSPLHDMTAGFKAYRTRVLSGLDAPNRKTLGYCFQIEMVYFAWRLGYRVVEVPICFRDRRVGQSKMSSSIFMEAVFKVPGLRAEADALHARLGPIGAARPS
jgi:dolichol-phosphate mannosyltransferase